MTEEQVGILRKKAIREWGMPGKSGKDEFMLSREQVREAYRRAKAHVLSGGNVPDNYGLSQWHMQRLRRLHAKLHPGWNAPLRLDHKGILRNSEGKRVNLPAKPDQSSEKVIYTRGKSVELAKIRTNLTEFAWQLVALFAP